MNQPDDALTTSREQRNRHIDRVDVLDKVKALVCLPGGTQVTTEMAATYFEVGVEAIKSAVKDNRSEVESDGYRIVEGDELRSLKDLSGIAGRQRSLALFPKRAMLRVAMLLRDSLIARAVRDELLNRAAAGDVPAVPRTFAEALRLAADQQERIEAQQAQIEADAPKVAYVDKFLRSSDTCLVRQLAKAIGMSEDDLRTELVDRRVIFRTPISRFSKSKNREVTEYRYEPCTKYMAWFREGDQPRAPRLHNGQLRTTLYVTPAGKVGIARLLGRLASTPLQLEGASA